MSEPDPLKFMTTQELWGRSTINARTGTPRGNFHIGKELMRRTDCSPARRKRANQEQAERRKQIAKREG